jgi:hypothetical protein
MELACYYVNFDRAKAVLLKASIDLTVAHGHSPTLLYSQAFRLPQASVSLCNAARLPASRVGTTTLGNRGSFRAIPERSPNKITLIGLTPYL